MITEIEDIADPGTDNVDERVDYVLTGYWLLVGFIFFTVVFIIITLMILCSICRNNSSLDRIKWGRVILVILGLFMLILGVIVFLILVGSAVMSGFCGFIGKINKGEVSVLYEFDDFDPTIREFCELCFFKNSTGDLNTLVIPDTADVVVSNAQLNTISKLLDGLSSYRKYKNETNSQNFSQEIINQVIEWELYEKAAKLDFDNIETSLYSLNDMISCTDKEFDFTTLICNGNPDCVSIENTADYVAPPCVEQPNEAELKFDVLKLYFEEDKLLIQDMQNKLGNADNNDSVQSAYQQAKGNLLNLEIDVEKIEEELTNTLLYTRNFDSAWGNLEDCRTMRKVIIQLEKITCLEFNFYVYILLVISAVSLVILFLLNWAICCALRLGELKEKVQLPPTPGDYVTDNKDFNDGEKMPFY